MSTSGHTEQPDVSSTSGENRVTDGGQIVEASSSEEKPSNAATEASANTEADLTKAPKDDNSGKDDDLEDSEIQETESEKNMILAKKYLWYRCDTDDPTKWHGQKYYWLHWQTHEWRWIEPDEEYWIWDPASQQANWSLGLQKPAEKSSGRPPTITDDGEVLPRYNPRIHGDWDPNAPYAREYQVRKEREAQRQRQQDERAHQAYQAQQAPYATRELDPGAQSSSSRGMANDPNMYASTVNISTRNGAIIPAGQGAEMHNDYNKSTRQLNAFFDVDAAASAHDGRSLREQRRKRKFTKEEIKEMSERKKEKKRVKQMAWLTS